MTSGFSACALSCAKNLQYTSLSPLLHSNLDSCDNFNQVNGFGSYLYLVKCENTTILEDTANYQKFSYNKSKKTLISKCDHKMSISMLEKGPYSVLADGQGEVGKVVSDFGLKKAGFA